MQCPVCHAQVAQGEKFCASCGTSLVSAVPVENKPDPLLGKTIADKYKVVRLLGEGGMGCVYLAEQMLGTKARNVALKTLHKHLSDDEKIRARFQREVGTVAELEHPNTIQVFDFGQTPEGLLYIVMEFVQGRSIADVLEKEGAIDPARVLHILTQVGGSLAEAHAHGIIHRDLKPDNVVLTDRAGQKDFVKVLDFGIAKRSHDEEDKNEAKLTQQGMVLGTPQYMSPEQFMGKPIDGRADIYALSVMAYEMLTGTLPFQGNTAWELATQHMTQPPRAIDETPHNALIPDAMRKAIRRGLEKDPNARFANMKEFVDAMSGVGVAPGANMQNASNSDAGLKGKTQLGEPLALTPVQAQVIHTPNPFNAGAGGMQRGTAMGPAVPEAFAGYATPPPGYTPTPAPTPAPPYGPPGMQPQPSHPSYPSPQPQPPMMTPAGVAPYGSPPEREGSGNRGLLLGVAAVIAIVSGGLIAFAVWPKSRTPAPLDLADTSTAPIATPDPAPTQTAPDPTSTVSTKLVSTSTPRPHPVAVDAGHSTPHPTTQPTQNNPFPIPTPLPTPHPTFTVPHPMTMEQQRACEAAMFARMNGQPDPNADAKCRGQ